MDSCKDSKEKQSQRAEAAQIHTKSMCTIYIVQMPVEPNMMRDLPSKGECQRKNEQDT